VSLEIQNWPVVKKPHIESYSRRRLLVRQIFALLNTAAAHNIVVNTANRLDIAISRFFLVKFCGVFQRLRAVTAGEALIQRLPLMPYTLRLSFSSVHAPIISLSVHLSLLIL
jgi:hypothetical protein